MSVGGSIQEITLAGRSFAATADSDTSRKLGGYTNDLQSNGNGTERMIKTVSGWRHNGNVVDIDDTKGDQEFLQDLQDRNDYFPITITYASGAIYEGSGQIIGEVMFNNQSTSAGFDLGGEGRLQRQN